MAFCYNGPRVHLGYCPALQYIPCSAVIYSKGSVLIYKIS